MQTFIIQALIWAGSSLFRRILTSIGIGFASLAVILPLVRSSIDLVLRKFDNIGTDALAILELAGLSEALSILLSAVLIRAYLLSIRKIMVNK